MASPMETVIPADFRLPGALIALGGALTLGGNGSGLPIAGIGALLGLQATRVRFVFDDEAMEVKIGKGEELTDSGENFVVGGKVLPFWFPTQHNKLVSLF